LKKVEMGGIGEKLLWVSIRYMPVCFFSFGLLGVAFCISVLNI